MTVRLPSLKASEVIRALERGGFVVVRSAGSDHRLVHRDDASGATTVAVHQGRHLPRPVLQAILKQARPTPEEFLALL